MLIYQKKTEVHNRFSIFNKNYQQLFGKNKKLRTCMQVLLYFLLFVLRMYYDFLNFLFNSWFTVVPISAIHHSIYICTYMCVYMYTHTHTHILFLILVSIILYPKRWDIVPCGRTSLLIHSKCNSLHLPTPNSPPTILPPPSLLATTSLFSTSVSLFLFCRYIHLCYILDSTYKWYHVVFVFLFLTYLTW